MRKLSYHYSMQLLFSEPVDRHHFTLRCFPRENERQQLTGQQIKIEPSYVGGFEVDSFGNHCIYGLIEKPHMQFKVDVCGIACICDNIQQSIEKPQKTGMFRYHTKLTEPGKAIRELYESCGKKESHERNVDRGIHMMNIIYDRLDYVQGVTGVRTTSEEAAELGKGVCQDYSHILLTLLRMEHIPCRYVVGMMFGEGASHAWVEVCDRDQWIALDPTNNCMVDDHYICISHGRDANDCTINQGYFCGSPKQLQEIHVSVEEVEND